MYTIRSRFCSRPLILPRRRASFSTRMISPALPLVAIVAAAIRPCRVYAPVCMQPSPGNRFVEGARMNHIEPSDYSVSCFVEPALPILICLLGSFCLLKLGDPIALCSGGETDAFLCSL